MSYEQEWKGRPYAGYLEGTLQALFGLDPEAIMVVAIMGNGQTMTSSFNVDAGMRWEMLGSIMHDQIMDIVRANKKTLLDEPGE